MRLPQAADTLGTHYQTAYGRVRRGLLPARKAGGCYQVIEADVGALRGGPRACRRRGRSGPGTGHPPVRRSPQ